METMYYISHHGIMGMKWGVRRYQNSDGSLTAAGKARYGENATTLKKAYGDKFDRDLRTEANYSKAKSAAKATFKKSKAQYKAAKKEAKTKYKKSLERNKKSLYKDLSNTTNSSILAEGAKWGKVAVGSYAASKVAGAVGNKGAQALLTGVAMGSAFNAMAVTTTNLGAKYLSKKLAN